MVGSVGDTAVSSEVYVKHLKLSRTTNFEELFLHNDLVVPIGQMSQHALQTREISYLTQVYNTNLSGYKALHISRLCYRFSRCTSGNKQLSSQMAKSDRSSYIYANWLNSTSPDDYRPGYVQYFLKHTVTLEELSKEIVILNVLLAYIG